MGDGGSWMRMEVMAALKAKLDCGLADSTNAKPFAFTLTREFEGETLQKSMQEDGLCVSLTHWQFK
jgi:hypothetical protein